MTIAEIMRAPDPLKAFAVAERKNAPTMQTQQEFNDYIETHLLSRGARVGEA